MWKKILFACSLLLGIGAVCAIPFLVGFDQTMSAIQSVGIGPIALYVANALLVLIVPAISWTILMRGEGLKVPVFDAIKANLMGYPLNYIPPSLYLGGEPVKLIYLSNKHNIAKRRLLATIIVAKFQEVAAIFLASLLALSAFTVQTDYFDARSEVLLLSVMLALISLLGLLCMAFVKNWQITVKGIDFLGRIGIAREKMKRLRVKAQEMEHLIHLTFTKRWRTYLVAQTITLVSALSVFIRPFIYFRFEGEGINLALDHLCMIYVATNFLNMFTIIPGAMGIFEGGMIGYFSATGLGEVRAVAFSLLNRIADIFILMVGTWFIIHLGLTGVARKVAKGEEQLKAEDIADAIHSEEEAIEIEEKAKTSRHDLR